MRFSLPVRFGIATCGSLIAYFLILSLFGLHTNVFFSLFNGVITAFGIYEAIKYLRIRDREQFTYSKGFTAGIVTGFSATLMYTVFFWLYCTELNPSFLEELLENWFNRLKGFPAIVFFTVAIMGFSTSLVLTLSFMQLFKSSNNLKKKTS